MKIPIFCTETTILSVKCSTYEVVVEKRLANSVSFDCLMRIP